MSIPLRVVAIGYGRHLFDSKNMERRRMVACAVGTTHYHMVIFTHHNDGLQSVTEGNLTLHPTNSHSRFTMLLDAYRLGKKIITSNEGNWVVTAQDPFEAGVVGWRIARHCKVSFNVQEHGDFYSSPYWRTDRLSNRIRSYVGRAILRRADTVRVVSKRIQRAVEQLGVKRERIVMLPVRSDAITSTSGEESAVMAELRARLSDDAVLVLGMGRLVTQKNFHMLLRAFKKVTVSCPQAHLMIVGSGPLQSELTDLIRTLGLSDKVTLSPWTDKPIVLIKAADIFALSSSWEGWARVLIEAMVVGTPVVTTDVGCVGEVLLHERHGYVVPVGDEAAFAQGLETLITHETIRQNFSQQAQRDVVEAHTSMEAYTQAWLGVFEMTWRCTRNGT